MIVDDQSSDGLLRELASLRQRNAELELQVTTYQKHIAADNDFSTNALALVSIIDANGEIKRINEAWANQLGYQIEEVLDHSFIEFLHPDDVERTLEAARKLMSEGGTTFAFENRNRHKDGSYRNIQWTCTCNPENGDLYCIAMDITDRKLAEQERDIYVAAMQHLPNPLWISHLVDPSDPSSSVLAAVNDAAERFAFHGTPLREQIGHRLVDVSQYVIHDELRKCADVAITGIPFLSSREHRDASGHNVYTALVFPLPNQHFGVLYVDITHQKQAEEALRQSIRQEEIIQAQKLILDELSTPLIPISDKIVVLPLIGSVDSHRAQQVLETLLYGIATTQATFVILDITGVTVVDTQVADAFIRAAQAVRLLGAQMMLTGIRPEVAQTLIGLGVDLSGIITSSSLQSGITRAMGRQ